MFFVISGFLITRIIDLDKGGLFRPSWKSFYVRRIGRIVPLFLFAVGLGLLFNLCPHLDSKKFNYCFKLPANPADPLFWSSIFTSTFNWVEALWGGSWKGIGIHWVVFWSLAVEEQFYFFYPWVLRKMNGPKALSRFLLLVAAASFLWRLGLFLAGEENISVSMRVFIGSFDQIAIGALLYLVHRGYRPYFMGKPKLCWALVGGGISVLILNHLTTFCIVNKADRVYAPSLVALGLFLFLLGGLHLEFFESKYFKFFALPGKYSYGNYLLHITALYFLHSVLWDLNIVVAFLLYVGVTTLFSSLSFRFLEKPANRFIRKCLGPRPVIPGWMH